MAIKFSTGLRNHVLGSGSLANALNGGFLNIYAGTVPADADASLGGAVLLATVSVDGGGTVGLSFGTPAVSGVLSKTAANWSGTVLVGGTAAFFRWIITGDAGDASTAAIRMQGTAGLVGTDLVLSNIVLVESAVQTIDYFNIALPASV
jgi:hypothetical protein